MNAARASRSRRRRKSEEGALPALSARRGLELRFMLSVTIARGDDLFEIEAASSSTVIELKQRLAPDCGVRVSAVCPGDVLTRMLSDHEPEARRRGIPPAAAARDVVRLAVNGLGADALPLKLRTNIEQSIARGLAGRRISKASMPSIT